MYLQNLQCKYEWPNGRLTAAKTFHFLFYSFFHQRPKSPHLTDIRSVYSAVFWLLKLWKIVEQQQKSRVQSYNITRIIYNRDCDYEWLYTTNNVISFSTSANKLSAAEEADSNLGSIGSKFWFWSIFPSLNLFSVLFAIVWLFNVKVILMDWTAGVNCAQFLSSLFSYHRLFKIPQRDFVDFFGLFHSTSKQ